MSEDKFDFLNFRREIDAGYAMTFGTDEPLYENLLKESGYVDRLRQAKAPTVVLLGCAIKETLQEFVRFINNYNKNSKIVIVDISGRALKESKEGLSEMSKASRARVSFLQTDGIEMGIANNSADAVFTSRLLHNLPGNKEVLWPADSVPTSSLLREIHRVLKPSAGVFLVELGSGMHWGHWGRIHGRDASDSFLKRIGFRKVGVSELPGLTRNQYLEKYGLKRRVGDEKLSEYPWPMDKWHGDQVSTMAIAAYALK